LDLDGDRSNGRDNIKGVIQNAISGKTWVKFPDRRSCFHRCDTCDDRHEISYCEVDDAGQAWEAISVAIKGVDLFSKENALNCSACSVVVAGIVSSNAKKLAKVE